MRHDSQAVAGGCYNACPLMAAARLDHATYDRAVAPPRPSAVVGRDVRPRSRIGALRHALPPGSRIGVA